MSILNHIVHPFIRLLAKSLIKFPIYPFQDRAIPGNRPIIFVMNHSNVHDFPMAITVIKRQFFVLADDGPKGTPAGIAIDANGAIWVNRTSKESRKSSYDMMRYHLEKGHNLLIMLEGTWNMDRCLPMLPIPWSTTELAREFKCAIVPIVFEYPNADSCYYSIGEPLYVLEGEDKKEATNRLRDTMATMRWFFWESRGQFLREELNESDYNAYTVERAKEYLPKTYREFIEREKDFVFRPYTTYEQAFVHLFKLNPKPANAFLFNKRFDKIDYRALEECAAKEYKGE